MQGIMKVDDKSCSLDELIKRDKDRTKNSKTAATQKNQTGVRQKLKQVKQKANQVAGKIKGRVDQKGATTSRRGTKEMKVARKVIGKKKTLRLNPVSAITSGKKKKRVTLVATTKGKAGSRHEQKQQLKQRQQQRQKMRKTLKVAGGSKLTTAQTNRRRVTSFTSDGNSRMSSGNKVNVVKGLRFSAVRLKVRNLDDQKVTNEEIKKLFESQGELVMCKFDYNNFGNFLGSATVQYKRAEDARKAIDEYHEGELDGRVISVEHDLIKAGGGEVRDNRNSGQSKKVEMQRRTY